MKNQLGRGGDTSFYRLEYIVKGDQSRSLAAETIEHCWLACSGVTFSWVSYTAQVHLPRDVRNVTTHSGMVSPVSINNQKNLPHRHVWRRLFCFKIGSYYVASAGLELTIEIRLVQTHRYASASTSLVLGLELCSTTSSWWRQFFNWGPPFPGVPSWQQRWPITPTDPAGSKNNWALFPLTSPSLLLLFTWSLQSPSLIRLNFLNSQNVHPMLSKGLERMTDVPSPKVPEQKLTGPVMQEVPLCIFILLVDK